jgi:hypothetical protein
MSVPFPFSGKHPKFRIPGWAELLGPEECISAPEMARHFLITGETGSGKSVSAVMRLLEAILRYPEDDLYLAYANEALRGAEPQEKLRPSVLVVDPKQELADVVEREARGRQVVRVGYGEGSPVLHLFEGKPLKSLDPFEAVDVILQQSDFFVQDLARSREPVWSMQAAALLRDFVAIDMWLARRGKLRALWEEFRRKLANHKSYDGFLDSISYNATNYFKPHGTLLGLSGGEDALPFACYLDTCDEFKVPGELKVRLVTLHLLNHNTRSSVIWMANGILADLASEEFASCVCVNPIEAPPPQRRLSVTDALNHGHLVIYVPNNTSTIADMVGRCLKSKFFEFAFVRENKVRPFFYVVDEAHRFLTAGTQDGEQSLLDRCRAYRTGVVLATQSIAAMAYKLEGGAGRGKSALDMLLNNCGNALYFRTSDIQTKDNLIERIPMPPVLNRPHVLKVRPLTSLSVGSCYALRCNGTWGLFQVKVPDVNTAAASGVASAKPEGRPFVVRSRRARQKAEMPWLPFPEQAAL